MRNKESAMVKLCAPLTFALVCLFVLAACDNFFNPVNNNPPSKNGYGRVSISFVDEIASPTTSQRARTAWPSKVFDYVYTFTKAGESTGTVQAPDSDNCFTLEVGAYTVQVDGYMNSGASLVASGTSSFSVVSGTTKDVEVYLTINPLLTGNGIFVHTITFPSDATADITLQNWADYTYPLNTNPSDPTPLPINSSLTSHSVPAGVYLLTVQAKKSGGLYAGTMEVVYIEPSLTTLYEYKFEDEDFLIPFTVTFNSNGGTPATPQTMTVRPPATTLDALPTPTRTGHILDGWNTASDGTGTPFTTATTVTEDITVYAQWSTIKRARIVSGGAVGDYETLQDAIDNADDTGTTVTSPTEIIILQSFTATAIYTIPADKHIK
jgi:uncharacterized repeat protein (TIGR02543 family)